jgi:FKBP-type peptidyl-prolyl cis-trans isomerase SlyD
MSEQTLDVVADNVVVKMDYTLYVDGQVVDSSEGYGPLEFIQGHRNIIPGLEREIMGMQVGESREIVVKPADAYGEYDEDAFVDILRSQFPQSFDFQIGRTVRLSDPSGRLVTASIAEIGEKDVRLDMNHPLAGKELNFFAKIMDVRMATDEEIEAGRVGGHSCSCGGSCSSSSGGGCGDGSCNC